jgi:hypothetical protein
MRLSDPQVVETLVEHDASAAPAETAEARLADLHFDRFWFGLFVLR